MVVPVESIAGTQADHLMICAVQTYFICELQNCLHTSLSGWFILFILFYLVTTEWKDLSLSLFSYVPRPNYSPLTQVLIGRPPGSDDARFPRRRRCEKRSRQPVYTAFPFFLSSALVLLFGQARLVGCGATDQYKLAHNRQGCGFLQCLCTAPPGRFSRFHQQRWEGEGSAAAGNFCVSVCARASLHTCAQREFKQERQTFFF